MADSCHNNGTCIEGVLGFTCLCTRGYDGPTCDTGTHTVNSVYFMVLIIETGFK
jgi:hypothetical protein